MSKRKKKIVCIGSGTGTSVVLSEDNESSDGLLKQLFMYRFH